MPESSARLEAGLVKVSRGDCHVAVSAELASLHELHDLPREAVARSLGSCSLAPSTWPVPGMAAGSDATPWRRRSVPAHVEAESEPEATAAREPIQPIAPTSICLLRPVRQAMDPCLEVALAERWYENTRCVLVLKYLICGKDNPFSDEQVPEVFCCGTTNR